MNTLPRSPFRPGTRLLLPLVALAAALEPPARADGAIVTLAGSHVQRISSGGYSVLADELTVGVSSGAVQQASSPAFPVLAADDLDLQSYFVRDRGVAPEWTIDLEDWWDANGSDPDFFVFEVGGDDPLQAAAVLPGGILGQPVSVSGWTATSYMAVTGDLAGQWIHGLAFRATDLRDAAGVPLGAGQHLEGVRLLSSTLDGAAFCAVAPPAAGGRPGFQLSDGVYVPGRPRVWSPMEVLYKGATTFTELDVLPNPFLDRRLQVTFHGPSGQVLEVPGFFAGDGSGGARGAIWKVRFTPPEAGAWVAVASFRAGPGVAVVLDPVAGLPVEFDGATLGFQVLPVHPGAKGFHARGMLRHVGAHYLRFDDGSWFLKGGTNSPENLLAYFGFDAVADSGNLGALHRYDPHRAHWQPGDPDWIGATTGEDGRGLIGALNYLAGQGVNSVYFLPMNLGGDGQDVCPFVGQDDTDFDKTHYDLGRMEQWNRAFEHAQDLGILLQFVLAETELLNENWLDDGGLGPQRRLYFREMVARFGHHNAIKWNLCEENDWPVSSLGEFADRLRTLDPYDHPVAVHNYADDLSLYAALAGDDRFGATSVQYDPDLAGAHVETLRSMSAGAGHAWAVEMDENGPPATGLSPTNASDLRKRVLWDVYLSGAAGVEWYFGNLPNPIGGDQDVEDFSTRQSMWNYMRIARTFIETYLPFPSMSPRDVLLTGESGAFGGGEVFARSGDTYVVYYPSAASTGMLDLTETPGVSYSKRWFNPRAGLFQGPSTTVVGGQPLVVGAPPSTQGDDWVLLLKRL